MIFVSQRCAKERHNAVAHNLVNRAFITVNCFRHMFENRVEKFPRVLRITVCKQLHGTFHVSKQYRYLLALAFKHAF